MSRKNDEAVRDSMSKIASPKSSKADREEAFRTIGRIDRSERGRR